MWKYEDRSYRKSIRRKGHDYSKPGLYFITICIQSRAHLLGEIIDKKMILSDAGNLVIEEWLRLEDRFSHICLHEYVIMPDHFHAIIEIKEIDHQKVEPESHKNVSSKTLGNILGAFQSIVTVKYIRAVKELGWKPFYKRLWQRNYWETLIKDEQGYNRITEYIKNNPKKWRQ